MKPVKDNFSDQSRQYARFRPGYPEDLYQWVFQQLSGFERAWDCGTGNGQVARQLAKRFEVVLATDISEAQLSHAPKAENIMYRVARAEQTDLPGEFFDLVTVAQALHWFDFEGFFTEAQRVLKPGGWLAVWSYQLCRFDPDIDHHIQRFYHEIVADFWDPERAHIDNAYANVPFPFTPIPAPPFQQQVVWTIADVEGFLNSWSAVRHFRKKTGDDPVEPFIEELKKDWGKNPNRMVTFPIFLKMGQF